MCLANNGVKMNPYVQNHDRSHANDASLCTIQLTTVDCKLVIDDCTFDSGVIYFHNCMSCVNQLSGMDMSA